MDGDNPKKRKTTDNVERECPYLDTINRSALDFDFEPSCSISLQSGPHVYGCLVCGKFFRGRGRQTPAYTHSVDDGHYIFVHLFRGTFHCLPDDYEVRDPSLADISAALHPTFLPSEIASLDSNTGLARDLFGRRYLPGFVGLNNLNKTDCINAVVQALAHVRPLRDFFLGLTHETTVLPGKKSRKGKPPFTLSPLVLAFGDLIRKMWSDKRFKSNVDPHMLVQAISVASHKKYRVGQRAEAGELMTWLLNQLHLGLGGTRKAGSSIIYELFQGKVQLTTRQKKTETKETKGEQDDRLGSDDEEGPGNDDGDENVSVVVEETVTNTNFLQLTLDISEKPLFRDAEGGLVIPQEPLVTVLKKFNGVSFSDVLGRNGLLQKRRYRLLELPQYLVLHLARFQTTRYSQEKNPTIVAFPVKHLDLSQYVRSQFLREKPPTVSEVREMNVGELRALLTKYGMNDISQGAIEKSELIERTVEFVVNSLPDMLANKYDLVANITHNSPADVGREGQHDPLQDGSYKCHVQHCGTKQWYEMQDLHVQETMPQLIGVSESLVLVFERKRV